MAAYPRYKFYVVCANGRIGAGNDYREDAKDASRDLPKACRGKIVTRAGLERLSINPDRLGAWATDLA